MSQVIVLKLLKELGHATTGQVSRLAKERYPESSLYQYVSARLNALKKWKTVNKDDQGRWYIVEDSQ